VNRLAWFDPPAWERDLVTTVPPRAMYNKVTINPDRRVYLYL
jgi:hypothetical protein